MLAVQDKVSVNKPQIFIGRQPIFNSDLEVVGYELLFRSSNENSFDGRDGGQATSQVIHNALMDFSMDEIVGDVPAYINFPRGLEKKLP